MAAAEDITAIWLLDAQLGESVAQLPWVGHSITEDKAAALDSLQRFAAADLDLARRVASFSWFAAEIDRDHLLALDTIALIADQDLEAANSLSRSPWFTDGIPDMELLSRFHHRIVALDPELARSIAAFISIRENVRQDDLAILILFLTEMAMNDLELVRIITNYSWFTDGLAVEEVSLLEDISRVSDRVAELSSLLSATPWIADGMQPNERSLFEDLVSLAQHSTPLAVQVAEQVHPGTDDLGLGLAHSLGELGDSNPDELNRIANQPWVADGLDRRDSAFAVILSRVATRSLPLFGELLQSHSVERKQANLALAGDVDIWVFQNSPITDAQELFTIMEDTARVSEELYQVPFPKSDIILLVVDSDNTEHPIGGVHAGEHMVLQRISGQVLSVSHETAHYYARYGSAWFTEGGAEFVAAYLDQKKGVQRLSEHKTDTVRRLRDTCEYQGIANIAHLKYLTTYIFTGPGKGGCPYIMGEHLLLNIYETIGGPAMSRALEELYLAGFEAGRISEEAIYDAFWNHAPSGSKDAFAQLYRPLHGGDYENPEGEFEDDHGEEASSASGIAVGGSATGTFDYRFDFDFFEFEANQGDNYRIQIEHPSLHTSHVMLFAPDGLSPEIWNWKSIEQAATGPEVLWVAPTSGSHYLAVQNFAGYTGTYTLTITRTADQVDDHGDTVGTATLLHLMLLSKV